MAEQGQEQKRRQAIREQFNRLTELVPSLSPSQAKSEAMVLQKSEYLQSKEARSNLCKRLSISTDSWSSETGCASSASRSVYKFRRSVWMKISLFHKGRHYYKGGAHMRWRRRDCRDVGSKKSRRRLPLRDLCLRFRPTGGFVWP